MVLVNTAMFLRLRHHQAVLLLRRGPVHVIAAFFIGAAVIALFLSCAGVGAGCSERNRVAFIKTHKCAGTSVQNIVMRFGYSRNLTFAIGPRDVYLGHPTRFRHDMVPDLARYGRQYHILAHHNRFSTRQEYARLLGNDVFIITILREPMAMFESLAATLKLKGIHIDDFEDSRGKGHFMSYLSGKRTDYGRIGTNQMSFDLGLPTGVMNESRVVVNFIRRLNSELDLVLIAELMDESLVLLKHAMCWTTKDVVSFQQNARSSQFLPSRIPDKARRAILTANYVDVALYGFFKSRLLEEIAAFGAERMKEEVFALRKMRMAMYGDCVDSEDSADKVFPPQFVYRADVVGYRLKNVSRIVPASTCRQLAANELLFTNMVRRRQLMDISAFYFARWGAGQGAAPVTSAATSSVALLLLSLQLAWRAVCG
ncbi:galactosylceramide sulfotransferase-like [Dermacentor albipictus]|uniref:galactosylceramide sulfotransferase-like n=1 Tax=Dermacentor albipictus TaxID=60249 RepID=UPI0038FD32F2